MEILLIALFCFIINIPMGAWRSRHKKFSPQWFISVHAPVPLVVILRLTLGVEAIYIPLFVILSVAGQFAGGKIFGPKIRN